MHGTIRHTQNTITFDNEWISVSFNLQDGLSLQEFYDRKSKVSLGSGKRQTLLLDREPINLAQHNGAQVEVQEVSSQLCDGRTVGSQVNVIITLPLSGGGQLTINRHFTLYDHAGAIRWVDTWSSDTQLNGLRYSDLFSFHCSNTGEARAVDFFNCSDQSNQRVREFPATEKNSAAFFMHSGGSGLFLYKEGPSPESRIGADKTDLA